MNNAKDLKLNKTNGNLPNVKAAMSGWFMPMTFIKVEKQTIDFKVVEVKTNINFRGVWQPLDARKLELYPERQMDSSAWQVHSESFLPLDLDEIIEYDGTEFRIMGKIDYSLYGYWEYHLKRNKR